MFSRHLFFSPNLSQALRMVLLASAVILGSAFAFEYGLGLKPCHLCWLQRYPYFIVIALTLLGLTLLPRPRQRVWLMLLISALFLYETGLASYHVAVERKWIAGPTGCTSGDTSGMNTDELRAAIFNAPVVACDQPAWEAMGISMAGWNGLAAAALTLYSFAAWQRNRKAIHES